MLNIGKHASNGVYGPEQIQGLRSIFDAACGQLGSECLDETTRGEIAHLVLELANSGGLPADRMIDLAIQRGERRLHHLGRSARFVTVASALEASRK